jgi:hypothetical protein
MYRHLCQILFAAVNLPAVCPYQAHNHVEAGGLAGAIWT